MRKLWPVLAALMVLTAACRFETNVTIDVNADGSGTFITELGLDDEMRGLLESFGGGEDLLAGLDLGDGSTPVETRTEGEMTFFSTSQTFSSPADLQRVIDANQDQASFEDFELEVNDDGARFVAKTGPLSATDGVDVETLPFDPSSLTDDVFSANIFVQLPGNVTQHNADQEMSDGRLRWAISLTEPLDISAESSFGGDGVPWLPIIIAALAILGVGGFLMLRNRPDPAEAALGATPIPPEPMDFGSSSEPEVGAVAPELPPTDTAP